MASTTTKSDDQLFQDSLDEIIQMQKGVKRNERWLTVLSIMFSLFVIYLVYPNLVEMYNFHATYMQTQFKEYSVYFGTKLLEYSGDYNITQHQSVL